MPTVRWIALWLLSVCGLSACTGPDYMLVGSSIAPNADGEIDVEEADDGQRLVTVVLDNLPAPNRLGEDLSSYVLWLRSDDGQPKNAGVAQYDATARRAKAMGTTSPGAIDVMMTAEASGDVATPGRVVVASRKIKED